MKLPAPLRLLVEQRLPPLDDYEIVWSRLQAGEFGLPLIGPLVPEQFWDDPAAADSPAPLPHER